MKVFLSPSFGGTDNGDGGVRQVIEGMASALPSLGVEIVSDPEEADVLNLHMTDQNHCIERFPNKPIVASTHGAYWAGYEWGGWAIKANADVMDLIKVADVVTAPTEWVAQAIRRHTMRDVRVVPHGVTWTLPQAPSEGYVLWNKTRPDPVCDPEPMNQLAALMPEVQFVSTYGYEAANVTLTGRVSHTEALTAVSKAGVYLCTARETFGIGTLEALAAGVPVVGFGWGGQREFIQHGVDGWLVEPGNIQGLAEGVRWALAKRKTISPKARAKAALFTWQGAAEKYVAVFKDAISKRESKGPKVSVIVTAYNLERYLEECLQSVAAQTTKDLVECVIVDDASPDGCGAIADDWAAKDARFRVIHNKTNQYLSEARNIGIEAAKGEYILPLDADDLLPPTACEILSTALDNDRRLDIAYGGVEFIEEAAANRRWHSDWPMRFDFNQQLKGPGQLLPYASMFRRRVWELTGGYRRRCRSSEDQDMWLRAPSYGFRPAKVTEADCLIYRDRASSMSKSEGWRDHRRWYPWVKDLTLAPAGACTETQLPIPSCDPVAVSVIIPVGPGHEHLVIDAIDSVDAQTFRQWECIVINDSGGPLPNLPSWVRVIETEGRKGVAFARNRGIEAARGMLFLPLDADDYLQPEALKLMFNAHVQTGDIIYCDHYEDPERAYPEYGAVPPSDQTPMLTDEKGHLYWEPKGAFVPYQRPDYDARILVTKGILHPVTALTPVSAWKAVGGYDEQLSAWEDWAFQIAVADKGICSRRMAAPLFTYRKRTGMRRNDNAENFEQSKQGILSRFDEFWSGGKLPMACSTCGRKPSIMPPAVAQSFRAQMTSASSGAEPLESSVRVRYTGNVVGKRNYRGVTSYIYRFDASTPPMMVDKRDYDSFFSKRDDFELVDPEPITAPQETVAVASGPTLLAEGPPVR